MSHGNSMLLYAIIYGNACSVYMIRKSLRMEQLATSVASPIAFHERHYVLSAPDAFLLSVSIMILVSTR